MYVEGATRETLEAAAQAVGIRLSELRPWGKGFRFRLKTSGPTSDGRPVRYGRRSRMRARSGRRRRIPGAVCWHGHRAYMLALFERAPSALLSTSLATYRGARDFARKYRDTYWATSSPGAWANHAPAAELPCDCEEGAPCGPPLPGSPRELR